MKAVIAYLIVAALAVVGGYGGAHLYHQFEINTTDEEFYPEDWVVSDASALSSDASVESPEHRFGTIDSGKTYRHEFVIKSTGTKDLEIWYDGDDLSPLSLDLTSEKMSIERGTTLPVAVRFDGKDIQEDFNVTIQISTNRKDGQPLVFQVSGQAPKN